MLTLIIFDITFHKVHSIYSFSLLKLYMACFYDESLNCVTAKVVLAPLWWDTLFNTFNLQKLLLFLITEFCLHLR